MLSTKNAVTIGVGITAACCDKSGSASPDTTVRTTNRTNQGIAAAAVKKNMAPEHAHERPQADGARRGVATEAPLEQEREQR